MREALSKVLAGATSDASVDRVLANAFYRTRPMQAGTVAHANVVNLSERRQSFLAANPQAHGGTRR